MSDQWAVQVAVMAALNADTILPDVFDAVPTGVARPYGTWGSPTSTRRGVFALPYAKRNSIEINWWGDERGSTPSGGAALFGNKQVAGFAARARAVLVAPIPILGGTMVYLRWENDTYLPEPDRGIRRVRQIYTIDTQ